MAANDKEIWNGMRHGNKEALSKIFISHYDNLFRYAKRFEPEADAVKDIIQDLFANIWSGRNRLG